MKECAICGKKIKQEDSISCPEEMDFKECHFDCAIKLPDKEEELKNII